MSNLEIKALELIITPKKEGKKAFLDTFIFEPENIEEQSLGNLYIIGEVTDISSNSEYLINLLVATIKKEYYSNTSRSPMESLESSLTKTNEMLADFAEQGNIEWIGNLHITIAVFKNSVFYFSQAGLSKALLVRGKNIIDIGQDLVSDLKPHPLKTFSNIASGQIDKEDKLILTTSKFLKHISEERIADIIASDPANAIEQFESALGEKNNIAAIFLEVKPKNALSFGFKKIGEDRLSDESQYSLKYDGKKDRLSEVINELNLAEKDIPASEKIRTAAKAARFVAENAKKLSLAAWSQAKKYSLAAYAALKPKVIALSNNARTRIKDLARAAGEKLKSSSFSAKILSNFENFKNAAAGKLSGITPDYIKSIPLKNRIIAVSLVIAIAAISYGAIVYRKAEQEKKNIQYYSSLLNAAQTAEKQAEVAQMYQDGNKTRDLIRLAMTNIEKLSQSGYFIPETNDLKKKTVGQLDKLEFVSRLENPSALVDFAANSQNIKTDGIVWLSNKLYSFNSANNAIYTYDFSDKTSKILAVNSRDTGHIKIGKPVDNKIIFLTDSPGIAVYDPKKPEIANVPIKLDGAENEILDIANYQSASTLYLLSKSDNEIYKHRLIAGGYDKGAKWISDAAGSNIQDPVSLAIDGNIYLLQDNADSAVLKLNKGAKKDFSAPVLLLPLKKASKILTSETMKNIYILDPENKRVVVMMKDGKLLKQFTSDKFDNLIDLAVSANEKGIYLLNKTSVYEIKL